MEYSSLAMKPYSIDFREKIVNAYEHGDTSIRKLATRFDVSKGLVPGRIRFLKKNIRMIQTNEFGIRDGGKLNPIIAGDQRFPSVPR